MNVETRKDIDEVSSRTDRVRVLFVIKRMIGGGAERVISMLSRHLNREQFEPSLATLCIDGPYRNDIPSDVKIHELRANEMKWAIPQLIGLVRKTRPHVIFSTLIETNIAVLLAQPFFPAGTKLIVRDSSNPTSILNHRVPLSAVSGRLYRWLYPRAHAVVCQSNAMEKDFVQHLPSEARKVYRIYNGVDVEMADIRAEGPTPFSSSGPNLLAVGRLDSGKNFSLLLEAFALTRSAFTTTQLTILGSGPEETQLKELARKLHIDDAVQFAGFRSNPFPYYRYADLFVQTSVYEGLPNALLEALSQGTPAVASSETGSTEEIARVVPSVRIVRELTASAFAKFIMEALRQPRPRFDRETFLETFGVERMLAEYEKLIANLAGKSLSCAGKIKEANGA